MRKTRTIALTLLVTATLALPTQAFADVAKVDKSVSFRDKPSLSSNRISYLKKGETLDIIEKVNAYWFKVKDKNNRVGYITTLDQYTTIFASGGSASNPGSSPSNGSASTKVTKIIQAGKKYLGTPYEFGSNRNNTNTFDCSDFVRQAFLDGANLKLPADSRGQGSYVKSHNAVKTDWRQLQPGDLMFFMSYKGTSASKYSGFNKSTQTITHVGIYLGNGQVMHTYSKESGGVRIDSIAGKHWEYRFLFGGSAL
ncbi:MAG: hydrolase Nlp/P60 [Paenibacillus sp.]|nr:hydrolase Nlp/P60 [Paenibacillus sp.]